MSIREKFMEQIIALSSRRLTNASSGITAEWQSQKNAVICRWHTFTGLEKLLAAAALFFFLLVIIQFCWIAVLHYNIAALSEQLHVQRTRIAQLEQTAKNHDTQLYTAEITLNDMEKKWHDLNFRVLKNTWKLDSSSNP